MIIYSTKHEKIVTSGSVTRFARACGRRRPSCIMSDLAAQPLQNSGNFSQSPAFADALQRAKQVSIHIHVCLHAFFQEQRLVGDGAECAGAMPPRFACYRVDF